MRALPLANVITSSSARRASPSATPACSGLMNTNVGSRCTKLPPPCGASVTEKARAVGNEYLVDGERAGTGCSQAVDIPRAIDDAARDRPGSRPEDGRAVIGRCAAETGADGEPPRLIDAAGEAPTAADRPSTVDPGREAGRGEGAGEARPPSAVARSDLARSVVADVTTDEPGRQRHERQRPADAAVDVGQCLAQFELLDQAHVAAAERGGNPGREKAEMIRALGQLRTQPTASIGARCDPSR
jgi:hypothetical protein